MRARCTLPTPTAALAAAVRSQHVHRAPTRLTTTTAGNRGRGDVRSAAPPTTFLLHTHTRSDAPREANGNATPGHPHRLERRVGRCSSRLGSRRSHRQLEAGVGCGDQHLHVTTPSPHGGTPTSAARFGTALPAGARRRHSTRCKLLFRAACTGSAAAATPRNPPAASSSRPSRRRRGWPWSG